MANRAKRIKKGAESLKKQIEKHFIKLENDIEEKNFERARYHAIEIDKSLIRSLEEKIKILAIDDNSVQVYKDRLEKLKEKLSLKNS